MQFYTSLALALISMPIRSKIGSLHSNDEPDRTPSIAILLSHSHSRLYVHQQLALSPSLSLESIRKLTRIIYSSTLWKEAPYLTRILLQQLQPIKNWQLSKTDYGIRDQPIALVEQQHVEGSFEIEAFLALYGFSPTFSTYFDSLCEYQVYLSLNNFILKERHPKSSALGANQKGNANRTEVSSSQMILFSDYDNNIMIHPYPYTLIIIINNTYLCI